MGEPILFFTNCKGVPNGVDISIDTLCNGLREIGWEEESIQIVAPNYWNKPGQPHILSAPSLPNLLKPEYPASLPYTRRFQAKLRNLPAAIAHAHHPFALGNVAINEAQRRGIPLVFTYHTRYTEYAHYVPLPGSHRLIRWLVRRFLRHCDHVIAPSQVAAADVSEYGIPVPVSVIPTGIPLPKTGDIDQRAQAEIRTKWQLPVGATLYLSVGRLAPEKNLEMVIRAFAEALPSLGQAKLIMVGPGNQAPYHRLCEQLGISRQVCFTGPIPYAELPAIYAQADVFLLASRTETQGLVTGEARASGCPSVATDEGAAGELIEHGVDGLVVPGTIGAFAHSMIQLGNNRRLLVQMKHHCRERASRFTPQVMAQRIWREVYYPAIERKQRLR